MLQRALDKLGDSPSLYASIDVDRIRKKIKEMQIENKLSIFAI